MSEKYFPNLFFFGRKTQYGLMVLSLYIYSFQTMECRASANRHVEAMELDSRLRQTWKIVQGTPASFTLKIRMKASEDVELLKHNSGHFLPFQT